MSANKFRFVSPGVFVSEIDKSQLPRIPAGIGPVVIGRASRGPGLVPVTVNSYEQFVELFGAPVRGVSITDPWREPGKLSPTYGAYAAQAYLRNSSPLTFVRLLGTQAPAGELEIGPKAKAGWKTTNTSPSSTPSSNGGAYGLFITTTGSNVQGTLGAIFYLNSGMIRLSGADTSDTNVGEKGAGVFVKNNNGTANEFRLQIHSSDGTKQKDVTFNFDRNSSKYIRKVFNTNPTLVNSNISSQATNYWLGETFEDAVNSLLGANGSYAFIAPLAKNSQNAANFEGKTATPASSPWVISQQLDSLTGSYAAANMDKLFRFAALNNGGEWEQNNIKVSIMDIKASTNDFYKFGSFTVAIRKVDDTDAKPQYLEMFTNCNLDPNSADFIANKIGDQYLEWDSDIKRYKRFGSFANKSSYIRVELSRAIENGELDPEVLPFGMEGPSQFKSFKLLSGSAVDSSMFIEGCNKMPSASLGSAQIAMNSVLTASISFPTLPLRTSASDAGTIDLRDAFYGVVTTKANTRAIFNEDYVDLVRAKSDTISTGSLTPSWYFSLDEIVLTGSAKSYWQSGSRTAGISLSAVSGGYKAVLDKEINRFTMPMVGGFDGLDITQKDPFSNDYLGNGTENESRNYAVCSLKQAIDAVSDPEVVECNLMTVPGITNKYVTNHLINVAENRADTLAIVDIEGGYVPAHENTLPENQRLGSVASTVQKLKDRGLNTSYACTYYPWVKIVDSQSGFPLWAPPSIVALGTMASSQERTELWFAPAGFNRGGLSEGSAGVAVIDVRDKLSQKDRDKLYEVNINPIASFPNEGIVIFGQKTLQVTPSALDRINVRRLMIFVKKQVSRAATSILFDQNTRVTWARFTGVVEPFLAGIKTRFGLTDYKVVLDDTTTTPDLIDRNIVYAKIYLKPARAIEFIALDFIITRTGASFDD